MNRDTLIRILFLAVLMFGVAACLCGCSHHDLRAEWWDLVRNQYIWVKPSELEAVNVLNDEAGSTGHEKTSEFKLQ